LNILAILLGKLPEKDLDVDGRIVDFKLRGYESVEFNSGYDHCICPLYYSLSSKNSTQYSPN
jgi:hypothetical protein